MLRLETERLVLRPLGTGDFEAYYSYTSVPENMVYTIFGPFTPEEARKFLEMYENWWKEDPPRVYEFAITLKKENGKMIGNCGLYMDDEKRATAMLGWYIHRDYWNQGYATEAVKALLKFGFEDLELHRIHAECNTDNIASARVMEKVGMRREGHFIKNRFDRVGDRKMWYSEFFYGILREEYLNKQPLYGGKEARLMDFFDVVDKRYSYRGEFLDTPVPREDLIKIVTAGIKAPSAGNLQTQSFLIVTDADLRAKIAEIIPHKGIATAPVLILLVSQRQELGPMKVSFELKDYGAAAENILLAIAALGYATVWTDGETSMIPERQEKLAELLGIPEDRSVRAVLPVGIPKDPGGKQAPRKPFDELVKFNRYS